MTHQQAFERIAELSKTEPQTILALPDAMDRQKEINELALAAINEFVERAKRKMAVD